MNLLREKLIVLLLSATMIITMMPTVAIAEVESAAGETPTIEEQVQEKEDAVEEITTEPVEETIAEPLMETATEPVAETAMEPLLKTVKGPVEETTTEPLGETVAEMPLMAASGPMLGASGPTRKGAELEPDGCKAGRFEWDESSEPDSNPFTLTVTVNWGGQTDSTTTQLYANGAGYYPEFKLNSNFSITSVQETGVSFNSATGVIEMNNTVGSLTINVIGDLAKATVNVENTTYNGAMQYPADLMTVSFGGKTLTSGVDYDLPNKSGGYGKKKSGSYTAVLTSANTSKFKGTQEVPWIIEKKLITLSGITAENKIYDGTTDAVLDFSAVTFGGFIEGDPAISIREENITGAFADKNAGKKKDVTISYGSDVLAGGGSNYMLDRVNSQTKTSATINKKYITITELPVKDKAYDGTTVAEIDYDGVVFDGVIAGDEQGLNEANVTAEFNNKNVGTDKPVHITYTAPVLKDHSNYQLDTANSVNDTTGDITKKAVAIKGITAIDKEYDGTTDAELDLSGVTFDGFVEGDPAIIIKDGKITGAFADKNAGEDKEVSITYGNDVLAGGGGNYELDRTNSQTTTNADITRRTIKITELKVFDKVYDGTTDATIDFTSVKFDRVVDGDEQSLIEKNVTAKFKNKQADEDGQYKDVYITYDETKPILKDHRNYVLDRENSVQVVKARTEKKELTMSGIKGVDKVYDGNTDAELDFSNVVFEGIVDGDDPATIGIKKDHVSGHFSDANVGENKTVTIEYGPDILYGGSGNYKLNKAECQETTEADITKRPVVLTIDDKSKVEGKKDPKFTASVDDLVDGDELVFFLDRESGEDPGEYQIFAELGENSNYDVTVEEGTLTIKEAPVVDSDDVNTGDENNITTYVLLMTLAAAGIIVLASRRRRDAE